MFTVLDFILFVNHLAVFRPRQHGLSTNTVNSDAFTAAVVGGVWLQSSDKQPAQFYPDNGG